ncbi:hypothetical protein SAMN05421810_103173 [Amycolatopsis arida]|uniref:Uncharacterized protein n=1 Tax=Amycolatopsis arida TaxID=587909 RepID=A0A1I5SKN1_9PSEU|nr:hypothetical protein CLV69_103585 [Amycolatopsis arida]SFP71279.1 hypothetical protein SAMN05421810_103173 [Amycolatopsis arida]
MWCARSPSARSGVAAAVYAPGRDTPNRARGTIAPGSGHAPPHGLQAPAIPPPHPDPKPPCGRGWRVKALFPALTRRPRPSTQSGFGVGTHLGRGGPHTWDGVGPHTRQRGQPGAGRGSDGLSGGTSGRLRGTAVADSRMRPAYPARGTATANSRTGFACPARGAGRRTPGPGARAPKPRRPRVASERGDTWRPEPGKLSPSTGSDPQISRSPSQHPHRRYAGSAAGPRGGRAVSRDGFVTVREVVVCSGELVALRVE